jgi:hypothetical protein
MNKNDFCYLIYKNKKSMKICRKCNTEKEISLYPKDKACKDGISNICKECHKIRCKEYDKENKEKVGKRKKEKYENNKIDILEKAKEYYLNNKEYKNSYSKNYYEINKENILKYRKDYYLNNKEIILSKAKFNYDNISSSWSKEEREILNRENRIRYSKNKENILEKRRKVHSLRMKNDVLYRLSKNIRTSIRESLRIDGRKKSKRTEEILGCNIEDFKIYLESKFEDWMTWGNRGLYNGELDYGWDIDHITPLASAETEEELLRLNHYTNLQPLCSKVNRDIKRDILDF